MTVHPSVLAGFGSASEAYERGRPTYPAEAVAWLGERLGLGPGTTVVDLAAGNGKLTRLLVPSGARVIGVEPVGAMRAQLAALLPEVEALPGYAERMPLPDAAADAVTVAQAFHWFATDEALAEIARVLRPRGRLGLIWNARDPEDELQRRLTQLIEPLRGDEATHVGAGWRPVVEASPLFGAIAEARFAFDQVLDADGLVDRVGSISFVAALPDERRAEVLAAVRALARGGRVRLPYETAAYVVPRRA